MSGWKTAMYLETRSNHCRKAPNSRVGEGGVWRCGRPAPSDSGTLRVLFEPGIRPRIAVAQPGSGPGSRCIAGSERVQTTEIPKCLGRRRCGVAPPSQPEDGVAAVPPLRKGPSATARRPFDKPNFLQSPSGPCYFGPPDAPHRCRFVVGDEGINAFELGDNTAKFRFLAGHFQMLYRSASNL